MIACLLISEWLLDFILVEIDVANRFWGLILCAIWLGKASGWHAAMQIVVRDCWCHSLSLDLTLWLHLAWIISVEVRTKDPSYTAFGVGC